MRIRAAAIAATFFAAVALAGCGSDSSTSYTEPTGPPIKTVKISGSSFKFTPSKVTVPAGIIQFDLDSTDIQHTIVIKGIPGFQVEAGSGGSGSGKVKLSKGTYTFYCNIAGHEAAGMKGTITVK